MKNVVMSPAETTRVLSPLARLQSFVTPVEDVFVIAHMGIARVDGDAWRLTVDGGPEGLVARPFTLDYAQLRALPSLTVTSFIECYGNPVEPDTPTRRVGNVIWRGAPLRDLLARAGVSRDATIVGFEGADWGTFANVPSDRYVKDLPLAIVLEREDVLVAWEMNGAPLTAEHGFPARLVVPGFFGTNSVKWLTRVALVDARPESLFTTKLYNRKVERDGVTVTEPVREADVHSVIVAPSDGDALVRGADVRVAGWAWGAWPVARVEVSVDAGAHWSEAAVDPRGRGHAWQRFAFAWRPASDGEARIQCRAVDDRGRTQPPRFALMAEGEQVHVSTYPPVWPTRDPKGGGNYDIASAIRIRAGAHSFEAKAFNIVASGFMDTAMRDALASISPDAARILDATPRSVSMVIDPTGEPVSEVMRDSEGLLYADIDLAACVEPKQFHDVVGAYNRFDVFTLTVDRTRHRPIHFLPPDADGGQEAGADDITLEA